MRMKLHTVRICEVDCGGGNNETMAEVHQLDVVAIKQMFDKGVVQS